MIVKGYSPGIIGKVTELHAVFYHEHWGFNASFEIQVGSELSDFVKHFDQDRDGIWIATIGEVFAGSIMIDGRLADTEGARLRWFIVAPEFQGTGLGKKLMERALSFCRSHAFSKIYLWTFEGLDAARALYERSGFHLVEEHQVQQWGQNINEQMFLLDLQI